jgi:hypothetical protein
VLSPGAFHEHIGPLDFRANKSHRVPSNGVEQNEEFVRIRVPPIPIFNREEGEAATGHRRGRGAFEAAAIT